MSQRRARMIASDPKHRKIGFCIFGQSIKLILSRLVVFAPSGAVVAGAVLGFFMGAFPQPLTGAWVPHKSLTVAGVPH